MPCPVGGSGVILSLAKIDNAGDGDKLDPSRPQLSLSVVDTTSGPIPPDLGNLATVRKLWLHNNQLNGELLMRV